MCAQALLLVVDNAQLLDDRSKRKAGQHQQHQTRDSVQSLLQYAYTGQLDEAFNVFSELLCFADCYEMASLVVLYARRKGSTCERRTLSFPHKIGNTIRDWKDVWQECLNTR